MNTPCFVAGYLGTIVGTWECEIECEILYGRRAIYAQVHILPFVVLNLGIQAYVHMRAGFDAINGIKYSISNNLRVTLLNPPEKKTQQIKLYR